MKIVFIFGMIAVLLFLFGCPGPNEFPENCEGKRMMETWKDPDTCQQCTCTKAGIVCLDSTCEGLDFCEETQDCLRKGLPHDDCEGNWKCISNKCTWECLEGDEPHPPPQPPTPPGPTTCTEGWKCKDANTKAHQKTDCSWENAVACDGGCLDGECVVVADACAGVVCEDYCVGSMNYYDGYCVDGSCQYFEWECAFGCENGDCLDVPCEGGCGDYCDGDMRYYGGMCVGGTCHYEYSVWCGDGCDNGQCLDIDSCAGVTCPDQCDGNTREYDGECFYGACLYTTEYCTEGCSEGVCIAESDAMIFVTSEAFNGNLGGIAGADAKCQSAATNAGLTGNWFALISTDSSAAYSRLVKTYYKTVNGITIADTHNSLFSETHPVLITTEFGGPTSYGGYTWTGTDDQGGPIYGNNCSNWTSADSGTGGAIGASEELDSKWIQASTLQCNESIGIYCVSLNAANPCDGVTCESYCDGNARKYNGYCVDGSCQYSTEQCEADCVDAECVNESTTIFVTSQVYNGNMGGLAGADSRCHTLGQQVEVGNWIALLSDGVTDGDDRIPDLIYKRVDGVTVASSKSDLFNGGIDNPINITEEGTTVAQGASVWTDTSQWGGGFGGESHCEQWSTDSGDTTGIAGNPHSNTSTWTFGPLLNCNQEAGLYCVLNK